MKLYVYKGFDRVFLSNIKETPLINSDIEQKIDYLKVDEQKVVVDIISKLYDENGVYWLTYEEYQVGIGTLTNISDKEIIIVKNNIYPDIYPVYSNISEDLYKEYLDNIDENTKITNVSINFKKFKKFRYVLVCA